MSSTLDPSALDRLLAKARALPAPPVAVQALWDGDTDGWFVYLSAVLEEGAGHRERVLMVCRTGTDIRLFNGQVPPWSEAELATELGQALAARLGVPFYFPSPDHPEDDCPCWWEQDQGYPCRRCGIPLLQRDPCPWRGVCYTCHLAEEKEQREAAWTPEERAGPRCAICGKPAKGAAGGEPRCAACLDRYDDYSCSRCGTGVLILKEVGHTDLCSLCVLAERLAGAREADLEAIRGAAATGGKIAGIRAAMRILGLSLGDAKVAVAVLTGELTLPPRAKGAAP
jgi:hypothetical protein